MTLETVFLIEMGYLCKKLCSLSVNMAVYYEEKFTVFIHILFIFIFYVFLIFCFLLFVFSILNFIDKLSNVTKA